MSKASTSEQTVRLTLRVPYPVWAELKSRPGTIDANARAAIAKGLSADRKPQQAKAGPEESSSPA